MEKSRTVTTQKHSLWQNCNYRMARQGFHYEWGLHLSGTRFFPAGIGRGQVSSPLGNFLVRFQIGTAGVGEGARRLGTE